MTRMFRLPLLLALAAPAAAAGYQDTAALDRRIANALGAGIGEPGGAAAPVDPALHLAACPQNVTIDPPVAGALAVRCASLGWRLRVPIARLAGAAPAGAAAGGYAGAGYGAPRAEPVVRRGDPVDLVAGSGGFSVSVSAVAQEDGAEGARVRVRPDGERAAGRTLFAEVIGPGRVRLPGFD